MKRPTRKTIVAGAAVVALAGGGGIAYGVSGNSEEQLTGPDADRAGAAAVEAAGGGTATEVEYQDSDGGGLYEVEVRRDDGSQVEVHLDGSFSPVGTAADDDGAGENEAGEAEDD